MGSRQDTSRQQLEPGPVVSGPGTREAQRRRTRTAIVEATQRLLRDGGGSPSVEEIAAAADVSRRTVYMYFPTLDQLVLDAAIGSLSSASIDAAFASSSDIDAAARVDALVRAILEQTARTLPLGRRIVRLTIDPDPHTHPAPTTPAAPRRGYRRVQWLERAVEPLRAELSTEQFDRLVSALAVVTGWEALTVLRDVRALDPAAEQQVSVWAARVLVEAMMTEAGVPGPSTHTVAGPGRSRVTARRRTGGR